VAIGFIPVLILYTVSVKTSLQYLCLDTVGCGAWYRALLGPADQQDQFAAPAPVALRGRGRSYCVSAFQLSGVQLSRLHLEIRPGVGSKHASADNAPVLFAAICLNPTPSRCLPIPRTA